MKERSALVGSLLAGLLASACCVGPLILGALGLGSLGIAAALAPLRPWFLGLTVLLLGAGFYFAYRPEGERACGPDGTCPPARGRNTQRLVLWIVTVLVVVLATYPSWGARLLSQRTPVVQASSMHNVVVLKVDGMTCAACEGEIEHELERVPGVGRAEVSFKMGRARIGLLKNVPAATLTAAVERSGYRARVVPAATPSAATSAK